MRDHFQRGPPANGIRPAGGLPALRLPLALGFGCEIPRAAKGCRIGGSLVDYVRLMLTLLEKLRERAGRGTNFGTARTGLVTVRAAARTRDWQSVQTGSTDSNAGLTSADAVVEAAAACC